MTQPDMLFEGIKEGEFEAADGASENGWITRTDRGGRKHKLGARAANLTLVLRRTHSGLGDHDSDNLTWARDRKGGQVLLLPMQSVEALQG
jgi:hypothetical protein